MWDASREGGTLMRGAPSDADARRSHSGQMIAPGAIRQIQDPRSSPFPQDSTRHRVTRYSALPRIAGLYRSRSSTGTMIDPPDQARLARLQEIRQGMEELRIEALAERRGRTFTTEGTLEFIRRDDLARR